MQREKNLIFNTVLYFFGSFGKGIAGTIIIFIGSFRINPSDMGVYDLIISTIALLQPILIFQINDGIYRWMLDDQARSESAIQCGYYIAFRNLIIANLILVPLLFLIEIEYSLLVLLLLNLNCIYPIFQQITRGLKNHRIFAVSGAINGSVMLGVSCFCLFVESMGYISFYIAQIIANLVTVIYLVTIQRLPGIHFVSNWNEIKVMHHEMQRYSFFLIPNSISQWVMKMLDKYCILFFLSAYSNGIYTVAHRFPDMFAMMNNMFYGAWVEQAIVEQKSKDGDQYFSKIYDLYSTFIMSLVLLIIPATKYVILYMIGDNYFEAYKYVSFLYIGYVFLALAGFIGTRYLAEKKSEGLAKTTVYGAVLNTFLNIALMPVFGLQIAAISSACAYGLMWGLRLIKAKNISISWSKFLSLLLIAIGFAVLVQMNNFYMDLLLECIAIGIFLFVNRTVLLNVWIIIQKVVARRKK